MEWNGKSLDTIGDLMDAMLAIDRASDAAEQAAAFMSAYRAESEHADPNIGYLTGYCGPEKAARLRELFDVSHPIFGRTTPTVDEALAAGKRMAFGETS